MAHQVLENNYYQSKFMQIGQGWPVVWNKDSNMYKTIQSTYDRINKNLDTLLNKNDPNKGAVGCYNHPDQCIQIYNDI